MAPADRTDSPTTVFGNHTGGIIRVSNSSSADASGELSEYDGVETVSKPRSTAEIFVPNTGTTPRADQTEVIQAFGLSGQERHTLMFYDADDRLTSVVDPIGRARAYLEMLRNFRRGVLRVVTP